MTKPKIGKRYIFVRITDGRIDHTDFTRHDDGSAGFVADGSYHIHECRPDAWQNALSELSRLGFVELREAQAQGIIPADWEPVTQSPAP